MSKLKEYLQLRQRLLNDPALSAMIQEYDSDIEKLNALLAVPDYDASEAIRLTNDAEYLSFMIGQNPLYQQYLSAKESVSCSMRERSCHMSGCNCAECMAQQSNRRIFEEKE